MKETTSDVTTTTYFKKKKTTLNLYLKLYTKYSRIHSGYITDAHLADKIWMFEYPMASQVVK